MVTIGILVVAALMFGYSQRYPMDKLIGLGVAGVFAGLLLFGAQAAFASQPKVPCWSEMKGMTQFFRAMPFACQEASPTRR